MWSVGVAIWSRSTNVACSGHDQALRLVVDGNADGPMAAPGIGGRAHVIPSSGHRVFARSESNCALSLIFFVLGGIQCTSQALLGDDLPTIRAALRDRVESIRTVQAKYRQQQDPNLRLPGQPQPISATSLCEWVWSDNLESFHRHPVPKVLAEHKWSFDGKETTSLYYDLESGGLQRAVVTPSRPRESDRPLSLANQLILLDVLWADDDLSAIVHSPGCRQIDHLLWNSQPVPTVEAVAQDSSNSPVTIRASFAPSLGWMPVIVICETHDDGDNAPVVRCSLNVESTTEITLGDGNRSLAFASKARQVSSVRDSGDIGAVRFELEELKVNHEIMPHSFTTQIPDGTSVTEIPSVRGAPQRDFIAGGPEYERKSIAKNADAVRKALALAQPLPLGLTHDATPPGPVRWQRWLLGAGAGCLVAAIFWRFRRATR